MQRLYAILGLGVDGDVEQRYNVMKKTGKGKEAVRDWVAGSV